MKESFAVLLTSALFLTLILSLTADKRFRNRVTGTAAAIAAVVGLLLYGSGFIYTLGFSVVSIIRSLLAVCRMFGGVNDLSGIQAAPWMQSDAVLTAFWIGHFLAFYATASATVATLGGKLLVRIRTALLKRGELLLIFGVNPRSLDYAKSCIARKKYALLFVGDCCDSTLQEAIQSAGGVVETTADALHPNSRLLRRIGLKPGGRRLHAVAMHEDGLRNLTWAQQLQSALIEKGIRPEQSSLLLQGVEECNAGILAGKGGFGSIYAFDPYSLAVRQMIRTLPPCRVISFDDNGLAQNNFEALIIGFGKMGRTVLEYLIMNGQFAGSIFRADIFDERPQIGSLEGSEILNRNVTFHHFSGKSREMYAFLRTARVNYIVICTGNALKNREIAQELAGWYGGQEHMPAMVQIGKDGLLCSEAGGTDMTWQELYTAQSLDPERADRMAMIIHQQHCAGNGKSAEENWKACDYFSRVSSRASADFTPAFLRMIGSEGKTAPVLSDTQLENLAKTEHLRWCAFHEVMGWRPMPPELWQQRAQEYSDGNHTIRIGKDSKNRLHACMIPWDALDALSAKENAVTGGTVDYKAMDRNNVLALGELLKRMEE